MKTLASGIKLGNVIIFNDDLWVVSSQPEQTKPGKGRAYVQIEMKNFKTGTKIYERFVSDDYIERAFLEQKPMQFLYREEDALVLMDGKTYEQITISSDLLGERAKLLHDGVMIDVEFYQETPVAARLPQSMDFEIIETAPHIKTATATSSYKPALIAGDIRVMVPPYITTGERVRIKTEDLSFVERIKN